MDPKDRRISDELLLKLIQYGEIVIRDIYDPNPILYVRGKIQKAHLNFPGGKHKMNSGDRYRWHIRWMGKRRSVYRNRLVWMYFHREVIEKGYLIHHGEGGRFDDSIRNLTRVSHEEHQLIHYGVGRLEY